MIGYGPNTCWMIKKVFPQTKVKIQNGARSLSSCALKPVSLCEDDLHQAPRDMIVSV